MSNVGSSRHASPAKRLSLSARAVATGAASGAPVSSADHSFSESAQ